MSGQRRLNLGTTGAPDIWGKRPAAFNPYSCPGQAPVLSGRTSPDMSGDVRECPAFPKRTTKAQLAAAWQAWEDAGKPWNPEQDQPPGAILDHALDACAADPMRAKWRR